MKLIGQNSDGSPYFTPADIADLRAVVEWRAYEIIAIEKLESDSENYDIADAMAEITYSFNAQLRYATFGRNRLGNKWELWATQSAELRNRGEENVGDEDFTK